MKFDSNEQSVESLFKVVKDKKKTAKENQNVNGFESNSVSNNKIKGFMAEQLSGLGLSKESIERILNISRS
jgi:hypothetical protein